MQVLIDWLGREGLMLLGWWLTLTAAGFIVWPLSFKLLRGLPDRGYTFMRTIGLLVIGYGFWLGGSLGFLTNSVGSLLLIAVAVLILGLFVMERQQMRKWISENWKYMLLVEVLFIGLFLSMAAFRALNPELFTTEKPMEIAFTAGIQQSQTFPPNDPWMAGYAISYYYFGYVLTAVLGMVVGVSAGIANNVMIATLFALTGISTFGIIYNLLRSRFLGHRRKGVMQPTPRSIAVLFGLMGIVFVLLLGNFHSAFVELPYQTGAASESYLQFWDEAERDVPKASGTANVSEWNYWWWFRASRVIRDYDLSGEPSGIQPIDEFPAFSFVLADMHPHVLALPFAVLALVLALNVVLSELAPGRDQVVFYALALGGLIFFNTWDGPIYMAVLIGAEALRRLRANGDGSLRWREDWRRLVTLSVAVAGLAFLFYAPFLVTFRSQLGGLLPNIIHPTRLHQFFLMFGPFLIILGFFLVVEVWRGQEEMNWSLAGRVVLIGLLVFLLLALFMGIIAWVRPEVRGAVYSIVETTDGDMGSVIMQVLGRRVVGLPLILVLLTAIVVVVARLFGRPAVAEDLTPYSGSTGFVLLLIGAGAVLALLPEFVYLRDNFGVRVNTLFKFYYQVWLLWAIASTYGAYTLLADVQWSERPAMPVRIVFGVIVGVIVVAGLSYTLPAMYSRGIVEAGWTADSAQTMTLDGGPTMASADDYAALLCLQDFVGDEQITILESIGQPYQPRNGGRISALSGYPTLLAWEGHERQWRGSSYNGVAGPRADVVERIYNDPNWAGVVDMVHNYGIDYIFVGSAEYQQYDPYGFAKFEQALTPVCQSGDTKIYRVSR